MYVMFGQIHLQPSLEENRQCRRRQRLQCLARINKRHCDVKPVYGADFCEAVAALQPTRDTSRSRWRSLGLAHCRRVHLSRRRREELVGRERTAPPQLNFWRQTTALERLVRDPLQYLEELQEILCRYVLLTSCLIVPGLIYMALSVDIVIQ